MTAPPDVSDFAERALLETRLLDPPLSIGAIASVDGYEVLRVLAQGGMALVLLGRSPDDAAPVAIKVIRPELLGSPRLVQRFVDEARHMAQLDHPGILRVIEWSARRTGPYYVMPYMPRGSLAGLTRGGPLDADTAQGIALQAAEALAFAHERGLTHRDVKPSNILMADDGRAVLGDFGLARTVFNDATLDAGQAVLEGSAPYVSPAVASGQAEDTRCDIYGLGATLYEMLTGRAPYAGATPAEVLAQVRAGPPLPLLTLNPRASRGLAAVCETCMARDLRDRYARMADVADDLRRVSAGERPLLRRRRGVAGPRGGTAPRSRGWWIGGTLLALLVLSLGWLALRGPEPDRPLVRDSPLAAPLVAQMRPRQLEARMIALEEGSRSLRFSGDGRYLFAGHNGATQHLEQMDGRTLAPIRAWRGAWGPMDVAAEAPRFALVDQGVPKVIDMESGEVLRACPAVVDGTAIAISPAGARLAYTGADVGATSTPRLRVIDVDSDRLLLDRPAGAAVASTLQFLDEARVALWHSDGSGIDIFDVERGEPVGSIRSHALWGTHIRRGDGTFVTVGVDATAQVFDARSLAPLGRLLGQAGDAAGATVLHDGRTVIADRVGAVFCFAPDGAEQWRYQHVQPAAAADATRDGARLAVASADGQLWLYALPSAEDAPEPSPLTLSPPAAGELLRQAPGTHALRSLALSPDGSSVYAGDAAGEVFAFDAATGRPLWRKRAARSAISRIAVADAESLVLATAADGVRRVRASDGAELATLDPAPAGQLIAATRDELIIASTGQGLRGVDPRSGEQRWRVDHRGFIFDVEADAGRIAQATDRFAVAVRDASGGLARRLIGHEGFVTSVRLVPGGGLILSGSADGTVRLWDLASGAVVRGFAHDGAVQSVDVDPRGRFLASAGADFLTLWDLATGSRLRSYPASKDCARVRVSPDGRSLWTIGPGPLLRKWSVQGG